MTQAAVQYPEVSGMSAFTADDSFRQEALADFTKMMAQEFKSRAPAPIPINDLGQMRPRNSEELFRMSKLLWESGWCPTSYKNLNQVIVAGAMGMELGLTLFQAVRSIAVINGRPSLWGDAMLALVRSSAKCKSVKEWFENLNPDGSVGEKTVACCRSIRNGDPEPIETRFYWQDAKTAGYLGKDTYKAHLKRMLQMRARGFCLRDAFPDLLNGIITAEEAMDYPEEPAAPVSNLNAKVEAMAAANGVNGSAGAAREVVIPSAPAPAPSTPSAPAAEPSKPANVGTVNREQPKRTRGNQTPPGELLHGNVPTDSTIKPGDIDFDDEQGGKEDGQ